MRIALLLLMVACSKGSSSEEGKVASCYAEAVQSCVEYRGGNLALGTESLAKLCTSLVDTAKFSETACPTAKLVSTCQRAEGKDFYYEGYPGKTDEASCASRGGKFAK